MLLAQLFHDTAFGRDFFCGFSARRAPCVVSTVPVTRSNQRVPMTQKLASSASSSWLTNSLICMALYGFWGFLSKLALVKGLSASQEATIEKVGFFVLMPLVMKPSSNDSGSSSSISSRPKMAILAALMSGASAAVASLFYSRAMAEGDAGAVSALMASYPPVTLMLGMAFGGETLTKNKLLGSILTVLGALFFARK